jgi:agmatinase
VVSFDPNAAAGRESGIFGLPYSPEDARVVLIPVPFEATCSYGGGTADGPRAILEASRQVDLFDVDTGKPYEAGIAMLEESEEVRAWNDEARALAKPIIEAGGEGDPAAVNALCEKMNDWVYTHARAWQSRGKLVGVVGGDHSTPFGNIRACAEVNEGMGILHLDAHADLREAYEGFTFSHASIMFNVLERIPQVKKLVQVGIRDLSEQEYALISSTAKGRLTTFFDAELARARDAGETWRAQVERICARLPSKVYLSWDIDGLDPVFCPHTGTPVPGGLSFNQVTTLLDGLKRSGKKIVGFDLNEVAPGEGSEWDGNVGARLLYKMIGYALLSR